MPSLTDRPVSLPETGFLRQPQVLAFVPISKSSLWRRVAAGTFPTPVKLSTKVTAWRAEDVRRWIADQGTNCMPAREAASQATQPRPAKDMRRDSPPIGNEIGFQNVEGRSSGVANGAVRVRAAPSTSALGHPPAPGNAGVLRRTGEASRPSTSNPPGRSGASRLLAEDSGGQVIDSLDNRYRAFGGIGRTS